MTCSPVPSPFAHPRQTFLSRLGITPDLPVDETAYAPTAPRTVQAATAFQTLRAPLTVLHGLAQRVSVGDDKSFRGNLDAMVRAGLPGLSAVNPIATAWAQALPNIINLVREGEICRAVVGVCVAVNKPRSLRFSDILRGIAQVGKTLNP